MGEEVIATSHRTAKLVVSAVAVVSLVTIIATNAVRTSAAEKKTQKTAARKVTKAADRKITRSKERRIYSSRSFTVGRGEVRLEQFTTPDFTPREKGYDILVEKSSRKMTVYRDGQVFRSYRVDLGFSPDGPKMSRGDGRTPEGTYYIAKRNPASRFYKSLLISYPSPKDAKHGVESGAVGRWVLDSVSSAYERRSEPPQDTSLGGNVCIHGDGSRTHGDRDWTAGCVAVTNSEMDEIFNTIPVGTPVTIRP